MKREDIKAAAKFTVICERCGKTVAHNVTDWTASKAMADHERGHRNADALLPVGGVA